MCKPKLPLLFLLIGCSMLQACSPDKFTSIYSSSSFYNKTSYNYYRNDELKVSVDFFYPYVFDTTITQSYHKRYKRMVKACYPKLKLNKSNFLIFSEKTFLEHYCNTAIYVLPGKQLTDTVFMDYKKKCILHTKIHNDTSYLQVFCLSKNNKIEKHFDWLEAESAVHMSRYRFGKDYRIDPPKISFDINRSDSANYLKAYSKLKQLEGSFKSKHDDWFLIQLQLTSSSFIQNNPQTQLLKEKFRKPDSLLAFTHTDNEARDFIISQCQDKQIVMLNEVHWEPKHRYLCNTLLADLYKKGFRYLAIEALGGETTDSLHQRGYPILRTGFYTKDPIFGNMIRNALALGYILIEYDTFGDQREYWQAKMLTDQTVAADPNAKVLVYAGLAHINKSASEKKMAWWVKELSGIEPFCIEQSKLDSYAYQLGNNNFGVVPHTYGDSYMVDMSIVNNYKYPEICAMPYTESKIHTLAIPPEAVPNEAMVSVYREEELDRYGFDAVPVLNCMVASETISLPPLPTSYRYRYYVRNSQKLIQQGELF